VCAWDRGGLVRLDHLPNWKWVNDRRNGIGAFTPTCLVSGKKNKEILPLKKLENSTLEHCEYGLGKCHAAWFLQNSDG